MYRCNTTPTSIFFLYLLHNRQQFQEKKHLNIKAYKQPPFTIHSSQPYVNWVNILNGKQNYIRCDASTPASLLYNDNLPKLNKWKISLLILFCLARKDLSTCLFSFPYEVSHHTNPPKFPISSQRLHKCACTQATIADNEVNCIFGNNTFGKNIKYIGGVVLASKLSIFFYVLFSAGTKIIKRAQSTTVHIEYWQSQLYQTVF